jgi:hypothetical protein
VLSRSAVGVLTTIGIPKAGQIPISPTICRAGSSTATGLGSLQQRWPVSWRLTNEADHGTIAMFAQIVAKCVGLFVASFTITTIVIVALALWSYKPDARYIEPATEQPQHSPAPVVEPPTKPRAIIQW